MTKHKSVLIEKKSKKSHVIGDCKNEVISELHELEDK